MLIAVASGCKGGSGGGLTPPSGLHVELSGFDTITLTWTSPRGADQLEVQGRLAGGAWEALGQAPGASLGILLELTPDAPEAATFGFRVRSVSGLTSSGWTAEVSVHRGVRPATGLMTSAGLGPPPVVSLAWTLGSTQADALRLERRVAPVGAAPGPWSALPRLAMDATSYVDLDLAIWVDGAVVEYRLTYVKAGEASEPAVASSAAAPPLAPLGLTSVPSGPDGIRLAWTPRSRYARKQVVLRQPRLAPGLTEVAALPPDAASLVDTVPAPGTYVYRISARVGDEANEVFHFADGDPVVGHTALAGLPLAISNVHVPGGAVAVRDMAGWFATAGASMYTISTWRETARGWDLHETTRDVYVALAPPGLLLGAGGRVELLHAPVISIPPVLSREWFDGSWHGETVADIQAADAALDGAGALHLVDCRSGSLRHATDASGAWVTESIAAADFAERCAIAVGPGGDVRLAYAAPRPVPPGQGGSPTASDVHVLFQGAGGWTNELVPLGTEGAVIGARFLRIHAPAADQTVVLFQGRTADATAIDIRSAALDGAQWGAPVSVGQRAFNGREESIVSGMTGDGSRVAVAWNGFTTGGCCSPATYAVRGAGGAWSSHLLHDTDANLAIGFTPVGKLWVLELPAIVAPGGLLYEEP
jgi:hypothetical protein